VKSKVGNDSINIKEAIYQLVKPQTADSLAAIYNDAIIKNTTNYLKSVKPSTNITVIKSEIKEPDNTGSLSRFLKLSLIC
jgi:hypothetical protein